VKKRKGQYVRARRRHAQSQARQQRIERTAALMEIGFDVDEIAALLGMSKSTIYDYKNDVEHNDYPTSEAVKQIEAVQSNLDAGLDRKEAAKLYIKVIENFLNNFGSIENFCSALEYKLNLEELEYEDASYDDLNDLIGSFVSRRDSYLRKAKIHLYSGISVMLLGAMLFLSGLWHLIINLDALGALTIVAGGLMSYGGIEFAIYPEDEVIEEFLDISKEETIASQKFQTD
jgi:transcriptional regulator with XRE-family HTH domain